jgi:FkbM family methyltransferase
MRLTALRVLERIAALLRRLGLGGLVDRVRGRALRGLGDFTERVDDITLTGDVALHSHYVRQLKEAERESATLRLFTETVRPGMTVLDIGAHLGHFSLIAAKRGAQVIAFEPNPETLPYLRRNLEANGVTDSVRLVQRAVGAKAGAVTFYTSSDGEQSSLHAHEAAEGAVTVEMTPVDDETSGLRVDVIKMDVEGAEVAALEGMRRTLAEASPEMLMLVERNPAALRRAGHEPGALDAALRAQGLVTEELDVEAEGDYVNLACRRA